MRILASLLVAAALSSGPVASGQTPGAKVPPALLGSWTVKSGPLNPADRVVLAGDSAKLSNAAGETLGYISGTFATQGDADLGVHWTLHAFQLTDAKLSETVWKEAIDKNGDGAYNLLRTTWKLHYDAQNDELSGNYVDVFIDWNPNTGAYKEIVRKAPQEVRLARDLSACSFLAPAQGHSTERSKYQPWVKALLCQYLTADFQNNFADRTSFVEAAVSAFEARAADPNIGIGRNPTIVHIVTYHTAARSESGSVNLFSTLKIATATIRSKNDPDKAVAGFVDRLFITPKPKPAETESHADEAETALLAVYSAKKIADLIHDNPKGLETEAATEKVIAALGTFKKSFVTAAKDFEVKDIGIPPNDHVGNAPPAAESLTEENAKNLDPHDPGKNSSKLYIDKVPSRTLGSVRTAQATSKVIDNTRAPDQLEDIESVERYGPGAVAVMITVQTYLSLIVEVPSNVFSKDGKTNCKEHIDIHEQKHVKDTWDAWKELMIDGWTADLNAKSFPNQLSRTPVVPKLVGSPGKTWTVLTTWYYFNKADAKAAQADLEKFYATQQPVRKNAFVAECTKRAKKLHETENALDDNCDYTYDKNAADETSCAGTTYKIPR